MRSTTVAVARFCWKTRVAGGVKRGHPFCLMNLTRFLSTIFLLSSAALAAEPAQSRPNILFAIADDWGYGHASAYGCGWVETPGFDRVAKNGLLFQRAYTPNAKCAPSRAVIVTGRNSWQLKEAANHLCYFPAEYASFVEVLAGNGYEVGMTGKGWGPGEAKDAEGKPRQLTGKPYSKRRAQPLTSAINALDYAANFADFLAAAPEETVVFLVWSHGAASRIRVWQWSGKGGQEAGSDRPRARLLAG